MVDRVDAQTRRRIMAANRGKNTGPEVEVRKALHRQGFRYRIHDRGLPGTPDIVLRNKRVVIFVHGCYWHGHQCRRKPRSKSNKGFWHNKIDLTRKRDLKTRNEVLDKGWRVLVIWECAVRRQSPAFAESESLKTVIEWIRGEGRLAILSEGGFEECL